MTERLNNWQATSARLGSVSRRTVFNLWASGEPGSVTIGTRRFSTDAQIDAFIAGLPRSA